MPINKWPEDERPREKLISNGSASLTNAELIAIILRTGISSKNCRQSAIELANSILSQFSGLQPLLDISVNELSLIKGIGNAKAAQVVAAVELGKRIMADKSGSNTSFKCSEDVANYYIPLLKDLKNEQFRLLMLNIKNKIIKDVMVSQGSLTSSIVHPREVLKIAIKASAASVIFMHNHPSGDPEPSIDDIEITNRLCKSCSIVGINVLDHLIIAESGYFSFKQKNML